MKGRRVKGKEKSEGEERGGRGVKWRRGEGGRGVKGRRGEGREGSEGEERGGEGGE